MDRSSTSRFLTFCVLAFLLSACRKGDTAQRTAQKASAIEREEVVEKALADDAAKADAASVPLADLNRYPAGQSEVIDAMISKMKSDGLDPDDYFVQSFQEEATRFRFHLRHRGHATNYRERGDICGKCREAEYDKITRSVSLFGIK